MMGRFQSCKGVVERALRRAFYDGVLELYEGSVSDRVICVALEGSLALTINQTETLVIKLNEKAQRADETIDDGSDTAAHNSAKQETVSKAKKRKPDNQSVFPDRVVVKKEVKEEKIDSECDRHASSSYSDSPSLQEPRVNESEEHTPTSDHEHSEYDHLPSEAVSSTNWPDEMEVRKERVLPGRDGSPSQQPESSEPADKQGGESDQQVRGSERQSCIRRGSLPQQQPAETPATTSVKQEPETIVIDDEEDEQDNRFETPQYWAPWQQAARQQMKGKVLPVTMWTAQCDCPVCGEVLHSRRRLASHLDKHRHSFRTTCQVCRSDSLTLDALHLHLRALHAPRLFPLPATVTAESLVGQAMLPSTPYRQGSMSAIASLVSMASCPIGASSMAAMDSAAALIANSHATGIAAGASSRVTQVMEQILSYQSQLMRCSICKLIFSSKQDLLAHLASLHGIPTASSGNIMAGSSREGKQTGDGGVFDDDTQESEVDLMTSAAYTCFDCSMGFTSHSAYTQHCIMHHDSPTVASQGSCSVCHKAFDTWKALRSHYYSTHRITTFCDKCKLGFSSHDEMKAHYEATHGADTHSMAFICDICNKGFYSQSQCSAHKRSHISEKSFACQVCGSAFFKRGDLSKHFRTVHAPNRVFACRFCGKRGTRMDNMRSHVKSHGKHMTRDEILAMIEEVKT